MNCVAQIKDCPDKHNESDIGCGWRHPYISIFRDSKIISPPIVFFFLFVGRSECTSITFVRDSSNIYTCYWTSSGLYLLPQGTCIHLLMELFFTTFERINLTADLSNIWDVFDEASDSQYSGCYFWHFSHYTEEVTLIWKPVHYLLLSFSLRIPNFNGIH